eukprot:677905-Rhodomonas_salina.3
MPSPPVAESKPTRAADEVVLAAVALPSPPCAAATPACKRASTRAFPAAGCPERVGAVACVRVRSRCVSADSGRAAPEGEGPDRGDHGPVPERGAGGRLAARHADANLAREARGPERPRGLSQPPPLHAHRKRKRTHAASASDEWRQCGCVLLIGLLSWGGRPELSQCVLAAAARVRCRSECCIGRRAECGGHIQRRRVTFAVAGGRHRGAVSAGKEGAPGQSTRCRG